MMSLGILGQIYLVSMLVGGGFIAVNIFMGNISDGGDDGGAGSGSDDFGGGSGDSGGGGHDFNAGGDGGGGDGAGADRGGDDFGGGGNNIKLITPNIARMNLMHGAQSRAHHQLQMKGHSSGAPYIFGRVGGFFLSLLSPMALAMFLTFFGVFGLMFERMMPWLGFLTLIPAVLISLAISNLFKFAVRWLIVHGNVSTEAKAEDSVGQVGEIITPIKEGRVGEVTYVMGSKRYHAAARANKEGLEFKRGSKVIITEIKDHVVFVDECNLLEHM
jgi:membrane protein implicated in regulation of membrane protease activity